MKPRPTDAEFDALKKRRDDALQQIFEGVCKKEGLDPKETMFHASHSGGCYCACPDGPCQHIWDGPDGPEHTEEYMSSATCSRCGTVAMYHDMRCAP